jgi:hypothetical protein
MTHIYRLTIIDHSDFSNTCHESHHTTRTGATKHRDNCALPGVLDRTDKEYHTSIECNITKLYVMDAS